MFESSITIESLDDAVTAAYDALMAAGKRATADTLTDAWQAVRDQIVGA